jgi:MinD-like ATPase involved in chromosome partitioning or flagellar assembly
MVKSEILNNFSYLTKGGKPCQKIISIHSFRGGTGKSNDDANLSLLLADQGLRVGIVDTDYQSPAHSCAAGSGTE